MSTTHKYDTARLINELKGDIRQAEFYGSGDSGEVLTYSLPNYVATVAEDIVDRLNFDWYNNEGGGGRITFHPDGAITVYGYQTVHTEDTVINETYPGNPTP